jgi:hypothetical protein
MSAACSTLHFRLQVHLHRPDPLQESAVVSELVTAAKHVVVQGPAIAAYVAFAEEAKERLDTMAYVEVGPEVAYWPAWSAEDIADMYAFVELAAFAVAAAVVAAAAAVAAMN